MRVKPTPNKIAENKVQDLHFRYLKFLVMGFFLGGWCLQEAFRLLGMNVPQKKTRVF